MRTVINWVAALFKEQGKIRMYFIIIFIVIKIDEKNV